MNIAVIEVETDIAPVDISPVRPGVYGAVIKGPRRVRRGEALDGRSAHLCFQGQIVNPEAPLWLRRPGDRLVVGAWMMQDGAVAMSIFAIDTNGLDQRVVLRRSQLEIPSGFKQEVSAGQSTIRVRNYNEQ